MCGTSLMVKKGQLDVSKMDSPHQGEPRDPDGPTPEGMRGHSPGAHGTAQVKRQSGSIGLAEPARA